MLYPVNRRTYNITIVIRTEFSFSLDSGFRFLHTLDIFFSMSYYLIEMSMKSFAQIRHLKMAKTRYGLRVASLHLRR